MLGADIKFQNVSTVLSISKHDRAVVKNISIEICK